MKVRMELMNNRHFNSAPDRTGVPAVTGQNPTLRLMANTTAVRSQRPQVTHFSVMWGSADSVSWSVVCRWRVDTVPLGGAVRFNLQLPNLKDLPPCNRWEIPGFFHHLQFLQQVTRATAHQSNIFKAIFSYVIGPNTGHRNYTEVQKKEAFGATNLERPVISDPSVSDRCACNLWEEKRPVWAVLFHVGQ